MTKNRAKKPSEVQPQHCYDVELKKTGHNPQDESDTNRALLTDLQPQGDCNSPLVSKGLISRFRGILVRTADI